MKEHTEYKPTQAEMTLLLKGRLMGKLTSFPTTETGKYSIGTQAYRALSHLEVCRLKNHCGIKQCLRNGCIEKNLLLGGLNNKSAPY